MNNTALFTANRGFNLIELMVSTTIALLMSLTVLSIYINQTSQLNSEVQRGDAAQEANRTFDMISRLLRQAHQSSINITYPATSSLNDQDTPELSNDAISLDFTLPTGFNIWPNDIAPYNKNSIRLSWDNIAQNENPYIIQIANAASVSDLNLAHFAGDNIGNQSRIINLDVWPLADQRTPQNSVDKTANSGYLLRVTARTATNDLTYINPDVASDSPYKHYRTYTVSGIISPRN